MANSTEREKELRPSYTNRDKPKFEISDRLTQFTRPVQLKQDTLHSLETSYIYKT